jgi:hypothetical protein
MPASCLLSLPVSQNLLLPPPSTLLFVCCRLRAGAALVALYGFAVAAMWISLFASEIVGLLQFFGMLRQAALLLASACRGRTPAWPWLPA